MLLSIAPHWKDHCPSINDRFIRREDVELIGD